MPRSEVAALAAIFVLALVLRLVAQLAYGSYVQPETWEYDAIARNLLTGQGYVYRFNEADWKTFGFPAFPATLAVLHALGGGPDDYGAVFAFLAVASASLAILSYVIAAQLFSRRAGLAAGALVALNPPLVLYSARVHELTFDAVIAAAALAALLWQGRSRRPGGVGVGLLAGMATLARPTIAAFAGIGLVSLAWRAPRRPLLVAAVVAVLVAAPWTLRTIAVLGGLGTPTNCVTLWLGNNAYATGGPVTADGRSVWDASPPEFRASILGRPEAEQGRIFCAAALDFLAARPLAAPLWWAQKLFYFWWFPPHAGILYPKGWIDAYRLLYAAELALVVVGALAVWRRGWRGGLALVALQLFVVSAAQAVGYVEGRHRLLLEPTLSALAACALASLPPLASLRGGPSQQMAGPGKDLRTHSGSPKLALAGPPRRPAGPAPSQLTRR